MGTRLIQVDPSEAMHIYASEAKQYPQHMAEKVIQTFLSSGVKCVRVEDEDYVTSGLWGGLKDYIRANKLKDRITLRQNLSKVYLIRK